MMQCSYQNRSVIYSQNRSVVTDQVPKKLGWMQPLKNTDVFLTDRN